MSELAEKSRQLAKVLAESCMVRDAYDYRSLDQETAAQRIEQALLAERRFAMEEAAKIADGMAETCIDPATCFDASHRKARKLANQLRAAAEKEVQR